MFKITLFIRKKIYILCSLQKTRVAITGYCTAAARAALPIPMGMCSIFVCPNNGIDASVWEFVNVPTQMLMHATAHTVRQWTLAVDSEILRPALVFRLFSQTLPVELSPSLSPAAIFSFCIFLLGKFLF